MLGSFRLKSIQIWHLIKIYHVMKMWNKWNWKVNKLTVRHRHAHAVTIVAPLTICKLFIRPILDHIDMVYKETYTFFHQNHNGNHLGANPTKCSNTNRHQTIHRLLAGGFFESLTILWSRRVKVMERQMEMV